LLRDAFDDDSDPVGVAGLAQDALGGAGAGAAASSLVNDDIDRSVSDDGFDINDLAGGNDDAGDAPDYQQAYDAPSFEQPVYEPPPTEFEQRMEAIDEELADTTDNFFDGL